MDGYEKNDGLIEVELGSAGLLGRSWMIPSSKGCWSLARSAWPRRRIDQ